MAGVSREVRAERVRYWQGLIEEHGRSGLSVLEFCKERKVAAPSFYHWRTKLRQESESSTPALLPVKVISVPERPKAVAGGCIQLLMPSGLSLTVSGLSAEDDLIRLLRAIHVVEAERSC